MIVDPTIRETYRKIKSESLVLANSKYPSRKYHARLLKIFKEQLTEDEQLYVISSLIETVHYKNIVTDPDNLITIHNLKLKTIGFIFLLVIVIMLLAAALFKTNTAINDLTNMLGDAFKLIGL